MTDQVTKADNAAHNKWVYDRIESRARYDGERIVADGKVIWAGLGNRSGLHDFQHTLMREKWEKSGERFMKKVRALPADTKIEFLTFVNINRDRGRWRVASTTHIR